MMHLIHFSCIEKRKRGCAVSQGLFTQTLSVLLKNPVSLDQVAQALERYEIVGRNDGSESWEFSGPALIIAFRPESKGYAIIDIVERPWPDDMGYEDQKSILFGAWGAGQFGPFTFPGSLQRATQQSWGWPEGKSAVDECSGFLRIRTSYGLNVDADSEEAVPDDYDPLEELEFLTELCSELLKLPQAICYFNPNGEVLRDRGTFEESASLCREHEIPTIDLWSNVRLFRFDEEWAMMDTVGNSQLGLPDVEACFDSEAYDFNRVDQLLRMVSMYLVGDEEFEDGQEIEDEEGVSWTMSMHGDSLCDPPREVIRLVPNDGRTLPAELQSPSED
jgi:hypothetical protein